METYVYTYTLGNRFSLGIAHLICFYLVRRVEYRPGVTECCGRGRELDRLCTDLIQLLKSVTINQSVDSLKLG